MVPWIGLDTTKGQNDNLELDFSWGFTQGNDGLQEVQYVFLSITHILGHGVRYICLDGVILGECKGSLKHWFVEPPREWELTYSI